MTNDLTVYNSRAPAVKSSSRTVANVRPPEPPQNLASSHNSRRLPIPNSEHRNHAHSISIDNGPQWSDNRPRELFATLLVLRRFRETTEAVSQSRSCPGNEGEDSSWHKIIYGYPEPVAKDTAILVSFFAFDIVSIDGVNEWWRQQGFAKTGLSDYKVAAIDSIMIERDILERTRSRPGRKLYAVAAALYDARGEVTSELGAVLAKSDDSATRVWRESSLDVPAGVKIAALGSVALPPDGVDWILHSPPVR